jgi:hypothetical protein
VKRGGATSGRDAVGNGMRHDKPAIALGSWKK